MAQMVEIDMGQMVKVQQNLSNKSFKTIPRDVYDFDEEDNETGGEFYWCEPDEDRLGSSAQASEQESRLSREDIPPLVVDASTKLDATNVVDSENGDDSDNDDTIWDWMQADKMMITKLLIRYSNDEAKYSTYKDLSLC
ncbi:hypothetical protein QVD17_06013 [Tagetes erecta]|uniref:Uncharacterized protein n=1 Tax=Tagetes erecta TaxID=13708 RepID=A0AAD8LFB6_TARER|nr:hypothetical protein QVD17_06013 [Tagetes erecta]